MPQPTTPALWEPPIWKDPKILWEPPAFPGVALVEITNVHDLLMWGMYMGHSGARYQKWALDTPIWKFLTFLDQDGWPHVTIHLKDEDYLYKRHPDDTYAMDERHWRWGYTPGPQDKNGHQKFWLLSTLYDDVDMHYSRPVIVDGKRYVVMGAGHRDKDYLWGGERKLVDQWYNMVVVPGSAPVAWRRK